MAKNLLILGLILIISISWSNALRCYSCQWDQYGSDGSSKECRGYPSSEFSVQCPEPEDPENNMAACETIVGQLSPYNRAIRRDCTVTRWDDPLICSYDFSDGQISNGIRCLCNYDECNYQAEEGENGVPALKSGHFLIILTLILSKFYLF